MYTGSCGKGSITTKNAFGKIKRSVLSLDFEKGVLKMIHIENQQKKVSHRMVSKTNPRKRHILGTNSRAVVQTTGKYTQYTERNGTPKLQPSYKQSRLPFLAGSHKSNDNDEQKPQSREHQDRTNLK